MSWVPQQSYSCCGPKYQAMPPPPQPSAWNLIYPTFMAGELPRTPPCSAASQNCCPGGKCLYCYGNFCAYQRQGGVPGVGLCMLGHATK
jgi:hypothetical protein